MLGQRVEDRHASRSYWRILLLPMAGGGPTRAPDDLGWGDEPPASVRNLLYGYNREAANGACCLLRRRDTEPAGSGVLYHLSVPKTTVDL